MQYHHESIAIVCSDRTTPIVADTDVASYVMPFDYTLLAVQAQLDGVAASGTFTVDINDDSTSLLSPKLTIDAGETSSQTASTPSALSTTSPTAVTVKSKSVLIAKGSKVTIDIDDDASGDALGLIVTLIGIRHL